MSAVITDPIGSPDRLSPDHLTPPRSGTASPVSPTTRANGSQIGVLKKGDKPISRSSSLLDMLHLKDVHIPTPPPVK